MSAPIVAACVTSKISFATLKAGFSNIPRVASWCVISHDLLHQRNMSRWIPNVLNTTPYMNKVIERKEDLILDLHREEDVSEKGIGITSEEQERKLSLEPNDPPDARILKVALIGAPNAGKSTLTNRLIQWKISAISTKVHTTRETTTTILTRRNTQIIFKDTPGIVDPSAKKKHNLQKSMVLDPERSLHDVDIVGVIVDAADKWTRNELNKKLLKILHLHPDLPSVLILNKTDAVKTKEMLLEIASKLTARKVGGSNIELTSTSRLSGSKRHKQNLLLKERLIEKYDKERKSQIDNQDNGDKCYTGSDDISVKEDPEDRHWKEYVGKMSHLEKVVQHQRSWPGFERVFMISALEDEGVEELRNFFFSKSVPGPWEYHSSLVSDQNPFDLAKMIVWEKMLDHLPQSIPYNLQPEIHHWDFDEKDRLTILMTVASPNTWHTRNLFGAKGSTLKIIAYEASQEIMNMLRYDVRLNITVKTKYQHTWK